MLYDFTMCPGKDCPVRQNCRRFTAKILGRQDFFAQAPYNFTTNSCEYFIRNRADEAQIRLRAYEIWQKMGCPDGKSVEHWLQAEKDYLS